MVARNQIAVLDHNSGLERDQAKTKDGKMRHKSQWSKVSDWHVPKKIMDKKGRKCVEEIINEITLGNREQWSYKSTKKRSIAKCENPGTEKLLENKQTRFVHTN